MPAYDTCEQAVHVVSAATLLVPAVISGTYFRSLHWRIAYIAAINAANVCMFDVGEGCNERGHSILCTDASILRSLGPKAMRTSGPESLQLLILKALWLLGGGEPACGSSRAPHFTGRTDGRKPTQRTQDLSPRTQDAYNSYMSKL